MLKVKIGVKMTGLLALILLFPALVWAGPQAEALKAEEKAAAFYKEGQSAYWTGNYAQALSLFSQVSAVSPRYKPLNVQIYQSLAAYRIKGKKNLPVVFPNPTSSQSGFKELLINDEQEWLHLASEAESIILDVSTYLERLKNQALVPEEKLIDPTFYLREGRLALERNQFLEVIRYGQLAIEKLDAAFAETTAPTARLLGKIGDTPVTINVTDLDLKEALRQIYELTGVNIVLSSGITGTMTMNVKDVPLRQVLDLIVETHGLNYLERDNVIMIMTPAEFEKTASGLALKEKKVFNLHYAEARAIAKIIRDSLRLENVTADLRTNSIVIDTGSATQTRDIENLIRSLDIPANEVLIEAQLLEVTYSNDRALGINFLIQNKLIDKVTLSGPRFGSVPAALPIDSESVYFALTHKDFSAIFNALAKEGRARLIMSPRIMTVSGTPAVITSTEDFPYTTSTVTQQPSATATNPLPPIITTQINTIQIGTTFQITPIIQNNRTVALNVSLLVDRVKEIMQVPTSFGTSGQIIYQPYPLVASRSTDQNVVLWDGESLIVGGIGNVDTFNNETRVPVLGKVPVLGNLFKRTTRTERTGELVLFLKPRIVLTSEEGRLLNREYESLPVLQEGPKQIIDRKWF
ncbi:MAG TPA: secretin N-terminal domain-containing protein [bacterium]|nr:secretin N-terminal domain-containing protein [bacterium]HNS48610.1 secretin N-terminal domain-containing protein [bacterium]